MEAENLALLLDGSGWSPMTGAAFGSWVSSPCVDGKLNAFIIKIPVA